LETFSTKTAELVSDENAAQVLARVRAKTRDRVRRLRERRRAVGPVAVA
jgi:hypothetical protein